mmetsp:Transcript_20759/g.67234  ORF Transcript_20759/g.67234 Transcript_20759/m.67234 type:complete len:308 (-) Transcript_20759:147-1070(-)
MSSFPVLLHHRRRHRRGGVLHEPESVHRVSARRRDSRQQVEVLQNLRLRHSLSRHQLRRGQELSDGGRERRLGPHALRVYRDYRAPRGGQVWQGPGDARRERIRRHAVPGVHPPKPRAGSHARRQHLSDRTAILRRGGGGARGPTEAPQGYVHVLQSLLQGEALPDGGVGADARTVLRLGTDHRDFEARGEALLQLGADGSRGRDQAEAARREPHFCGLSRRARKNRGTPRAARPRHPRNLLPRNQPPRNRHAHLGVLLQSRTRRSGGRQKGERRLSCAQDSTAATEALGPFRGYVHQPQAPMGRLG